jgi:hypothetical protein
LVFLFHQWSWIGVVVGFTFLPSVFICPIWEWISTGSYMTFIFVYVLGLDGMALLRNLGRLILPTKSLRTTGVQFGRRGRPLCSLASSCEMNFFGGHWALRQSLSVPEVVLWFLSIGDSVFALLLCPASSRRRQRSPIQVNREDDNFDASMSASKPKLKPAFWFVLLAVALMALRN